MTVPEGSIIEPVFRFTTTNTQVKQRANPFVFQAVGTGQQAIDQCVAIHQLTALPFQGLHRWQAIYQRLVATLSIRDTDITGVESRAALMTHNIYIALL